MHPEIPRGLLLRITPIAGQIHATPWQAHVNEGLVEWPPSPWRLLRTLTAVTYLRFPEWAHDGWLERAVDDLAATTPLYNLPPASSAHVRHYMPLPEGSGKTTKLFDAFLAVDRTTPIEVLWPGLEPSGEHFERFQAVWQAMHWLGRAESWVSVECTLGTLAPNTLPSDAATPDEVLESVLAPLPPQRWAQIRAQLVERMRIRRLEELRQNAASKGKPTDKVKLGAKDERKIEDSVPASILEALRVGTDAIRQAGWSDPPGSRVVRYVRPAIVPHPQRRIVLPATAGPRHTPYVARYALHSPVPPHLRDALATTERVHLSLVKHSDGAMVFSGRRQEQLEEGHRHVYLLPEVNAERSPYITHLSVYAPHGFDAFEPDGSPTLPANVRRALESVRALWSRRTEAPTQLVLLSCGPAEELRRTAMREGGARILGESRTWTSLTPMLLQRFPKRNRRGEPKLRPDGVEVDGPQDQVERLLTLHGLPQPERIVFHDAIHIANRSIRNTHFLVDRTRRSGTSGTSAREERRSPLPPQACTIMFSEPIAGPIALGGHAHFGLGLFVPIPEKPT